MKSLGRPHVGIHVPSRALCLGLCQGGGTSFPRVPRGKSGLGRLAEDGLLQGLPARALNFAVTKQDPDMRRNSVKFGHVEP